MTVFNSYNMHSGIIISNIIFGIYGSKRKASLVELTLLFTSPLALKCYTFTCEATVSQLVCLSTPSIIP